MLITLEGVDFTGKSTLINELARVIPCITTKEPGSSHIKKNLDLRALALGPDLNSFQRELIFYADALGHKAWIESQTDLVLSDRGLWSHYAYLYGTMKSGLLGENPDSNYTRYGLAKKLIKECCATPRGVIYLEGSLKLMESRLNRAKDSIESLGSEYFSYVLTAYDDLCIAQEIEQNPLLILNAEDTIELNVNKSLEFIGNLRNAA